MRMPSDYNAERRRSARWITGGDPPERPGSESRQRPFDDLQAALDARRLLRVPRRLAQLLQLERLGPQRLAVLVRLRAAAEPVLGVRADAVALPPRVVRVERDELGRGGGFLLPVLEALIRQGQLELDRAVALRGVGRRVPPVSY